MSDIKSLILAAQDRAREEVVVPEWGVTVYILQLTAAEMDAFQSSTIKKAGKNVEVNLRNASARLLAKCMVDDQGKRIFNDAEAEALGEKSAAVVRRLAEIAQRINAMSNDDMKEITQDFLGDQSISFASS